MRRERAEKVAGDPVAETREIQRWTRWTVGRGGTKKVGESKESVAGESDSQIKNLGCRIQI